MLTPLVVKAYTLHQYIIRINPFEVYWVSWNNSHQKWELERSRCPAWPFKPYYNIISFFLFFISLGCILFLIVIVRAHPNILTYPQAMMLGMFATLIALSIFYDVQMLINGITLTGVVNWTYEMEKTLGMRYYLMTGEQNTPKNETQNKRAGKIVQIWAALSTYREQLRKGLGIDLLIKEIKKMLHGEKVDWLSLFLMYIVFAYTVLSFIAPLVIELYNWDYIYMILHCVASNVFGFPDVSNSFVAVSVRMIICFETTQIVLVNARSFALIFVNLSVSYFNLLKRILEYSPSVPTIFIYKKLFIVNCYFEQIAGNLLIGYLTGTFVVITVGINAIITGFKITNIAVCSMALIVTVPFAGFLTFFFETSWLLFKTSKEGLRQWKYEANLKHGKLLRKQVASCQVIALRMAGLWMVDKEIKINYINFVLDAVANTLLAR